MHADILALVSEPDSFPPTLPDCKSEPSDDGLPLAPMSPFSSVKLECDPELALSRPHSNSVDPVPGLLLGFSFFFTEIDDSGCPVVDTPVGMSPQLDSLDNA